MQLRFMAVEPARRGTAKVLADDHYDDAFLRSGR
jgi:hypothetical protein